MHCLNLATAVATVLYDRHAKMNPDAHLNHTLQKRRGFEIMIQVPAPLQQWNDAVAYTSIDQGPADAYEEPPIENFFYTRETLCDVSTRYST
jgi:hypothetical protein